MEFRGCPRFRRTSNRLIAKRCFHSRGHAQGRGEGDSAQWKKDFAGTLGSIAPQGERDRVVGLDAFNYKCCIVISSN